MKLDIIIILSGGILLLFLLYYGYKANQKCLLPTKAALSALFVITALIQPHPIPSYFHFILTGLLLCLGGDIFLALPRDKMFRLGLVTFLIGHVFYAIGFFSAADLSMWTWVGTPIFLGLSGYVYFRIRPHLGAMNVPVLVYIIVITIMLSGAWSVLGESNLAGIGGVTVFLGASCFYISDLFVARDRFIKKKPINRFIGLPLYYSGQFLLAFSVGLL